MKPEYEQLLSQLQVFPGFTKSELEALAGVLKPRSLKKGSVLFREGEVGNACYLIARGRVRLWVSQDGKREQLAMLGRGDLFGQMSLLDGGARSASCTAVDPTTVLELTRSDFDLLFNSGSSFALKFVDVLTRVLVVQLRHATRRLLQLAEQKGKKSRTEDNKEALRKVAGGTMGYSLNDVRPEDLEVVVPEGLRRDDDGR